MNLYEYIGRIIGEAMFYEERTGERPSAVCVSAEKYKEMDEDFKKTFAAVNLRGIKTEPRLGGMRVYIADGLEGEGFFVGKLRTKTD